MRHTQAPRVQYGPIVCTGKTANIPWARLGILLQNSIELSSVVADLPICFSTAVGCCSREGAEWIVWIRATSGLQVMAMRAVHQKGAMKLHLPLLLCRDDYMRPLLKFPGSMNVPPPQSR